jgi:hypothetical protein
MILTSILGLELEVTGDATDVRPVMISSSLNA